MNLRQLEILTTVIQTGSFTGAAKVLHMAQPAVSIAIRKLESELEIQLISRADKISPTAEGLVLLEHAKKLLAQMQLAKQAMSDLHQLDKGLIRLSTTPILGNYFFPEKIEQFKKQYPNIDFQIINQGAIENLELLRQQRCDLAVTNIENPTSDLDILALEPQEIIACVSSKNPLANKKKINMKNLLKQPLAVYKAKHRLREIIERACEEYDMTAHIILETDLTGILLKTVASNSASALCLKSITEHEREVTALSFNKPLFLKPAICWQKNSYLSAANRAFLHFLKNQANS